MLLSSPRVASRTAISPLWRRSGRSESASGDFDSTGNRLSAKNNVARITPAAMVISRSLCGNAAPDWVVRGKVRIIDNVTAPFAPAIVVTSTFLMSSADVIEMGFMAHVGLGCSAICSAICSEVCSEPSSSSGWSGFSPSELLPARSFSLSTASFPVQRWPPLWSL